MLKLCRNDIARSLMAALFPVAACVVQWLLWGYIKPFAWFIFFPTIFLSSWVGGVVGGIAATIISAFLVVYVFLPPEYHFAVANPHHLYFVPAFVLMGIIFSLTHHRLKGATRRAEEALAEVKSAHDSLRQAHAEATRLYQKERQLGENLAALLAVEREESGADSDLSPEGRVAALENEELLEQVRDLLKDRRLREEELENARLAAMNLMEDAILARDRFEELALSHQQGEAEREQTVELLRICSRADSLRPLLGDLAAFFQRLTGMEEVGVRLSDGESFRYYDARVGFPEQMVLKGKGDRGNSGSSTVVAVADCVCRCVLEGCPPPGTYTAAGTFWTSSSSELFDAQHGPLAPRPCEICIVNHFESVALVPLRYREVSFGFFQFTDRRHGCLSAKKVGQLEELVAYVAVTLAKLESDQALKESRAFYQQIINSASEGLIVSSADMRCQVWNPYMEAITGLPAQEVLGKNPLELFPFLRDNGVLRDMEAALRGELPAPLDFSLSAPGAVTARWFSNRCAPLLNVGNEVVGVIGMVRDITQEKLLEEQLRHAQKMEAIGHLAGGVAHDFNNILMVIYGYCNLMRMQMEEGAPFRQEIDHVLAAAERAANLTKSLLAFSRKQVMLPKAVDLNALVVQVGNFLTRIIGEDIVLQHHQGSDPVMVLADSGQLEQVLMNLAANARDAMPGGGVLTVETGVCDIEEDFLHAHGYGTPGRYAFLSVRDSGLGMDRETCRKIFDPFFTTKGVGKGTGLGLSIVYGVVKQHNGYITVTSEPGAGSDFQIYLPLLSVAAEQDSLALPRGEGHAGRETILVAEDDAAIREYVEKILNKYGYRVILARNGAEAVDACRAAEGGAIDLVLLDMIMPVKSGTEAREEIRLSRPEMKVLFMSGYSPDLLLSRGAVAGRDDILLKPIQPLDFLRRIREVLDR